MKKIKNKKVYVGLSIDILHHGHINLINNAKKYGNLIVGLYTDKAILEKKRLPLITYNNRKKILENINGVFKVIPQNEWSYSNNIKKIKPDFMVHGDDWIKNEPELRMETIKSLKQIGGKLIEISHTKNISSSGLSQRMFNQNMMPMNRMSSLKRMLNHKKFCRIIETHSPLAALIAENTFILNKDGTKNEFDGFWSSSLTDSTLKGKPDIEVLEINQRLSNINEIFDVTSKPLIMDVDTGGKPEHFEINIKTIQRAGVSAVIVEDKKGLKKNSLFGVDVKQEQDSIKSFVKKIKIGKNVSDSEFMIIARIESLILNKPVSDAYKRASEYLSAGADGIMIHSKQKTPAEIFKFSNLFKKNFSDVPLIAVPSSYNSVKESQLIDNGFNIVIYANHLLRASHPAMEKTVLSILKNKRSLEIDSKLMSIKDILELIPGTK
jgi:phosphoenolpyruvate mutase